jgi:hypothetical protein
MRCKTKQEEDSRSANAIEEIRGRSPGIVAPRCVKTQWAWKKFDEINDRPG